MCNNDVAMTYMHPQKRGIEEAVAFSQKNLILVNQKDQQNLPENIFEKVANMRSQEDYNEIAKDLKDIGWAVLPVDNNKDYEIMGVGDDTIALKDLSNPDKVSVFEAKDKNHDGTLTYNEGSNNEFTKLTSYYDKPPIHQFLSNNGGLIPPRNEHHGCSHNSAPQMSWAPNQQCKPNKANFGMVVELLRMMEQSMQAQYNNYGFDAFNPGYGGLSRLSQAEPEMFGGYGYGIAGYSPDFDGLAGLDPMMFSNYGFGY